MIEGEGPEREGDHQEVCYCEGQGKDLSILLE